MITALVGLATVMHLFVIDCRNEHLSNMMMQVTDVNYTVHQQWNNEENYHVHS